MFRKLVDQYVIVRPSSNGASVFFGILRDIDGNVIVLENARRIWSWNGANTLSEVATTGVHPSSRIAVELKSVILNGWCEIIPCTDTAVASLQAAKW